MFSGLTPDTLQQRLPVWVISLARAPHRRQNAVDSLKAAGVSNYELIDAVDFHNASSVSKEHLHRWGNVSMGHEVVVLLAMLCYAGFCAI